jgi:crotonobetainyl-CoA:carnitine CoA-transferase CaiB-like acyl-CoA transferase
MGRNILSDQQLAALDGLRVIDASTIIAGPICAQILGDHGADVIKIEHPQKPDGLRGHGQQKDGHPLWWKEVGRNKRAVTLNLGTDDGADILKRLAKSSDVLIENFRPGTLERWGIGPEVLHEINPALVIVRITGFGQSGPYASRAGFGTLAESMSGFAHLTGPADAPPSLPAFGLADSICGIAASSATVMALRHRDRSGVGQVVDMSILEPILTAVGPSPTVYQQLGEVAQRNGNRSVNNAPRNTYQTADEKWIAISTSAQSIAERVLRLVGHPEVINEPWFSTGAGRVEHVELLDAYVAEWVGARKMDDVVEAFTEAGAAIAPIYDAAGVANDPHIRQTNMLTEVEDPDLGPLLQHNVMWRMSESPGSIRFTGREHGEDTDDVLSEVGYDQETINNLRESGVIK